MKIIKLCLLIVCLGCGDAPNKTSKDTSRFIYVVHNTFCDPCISTIIDKKYNIEYVVAASGHGYILLDKRTINAEKD